MKKQIIKGKDWKIVIFETGSACWTFPEYDKRINEAIIEMNKAIEEHKK